MSPVSTAEKPVASRSRQTQAERVAAMRTRLLDATLECLVENGYSQMSTNDVVRRAGVSRGALAHYFPTKAELVAAAGERLIGERVAEFEASFLALPPERRTVAEALDALWSYYEGPTFAALLELIVASRTDAELRAVLSDGPERITAACFAVFVKLFPQIAGNPAADQLLRATLATLAGLALQTIVDGDSHGRHAALRETIKMLGAAILPGPGAGAT